MNNIDLFEKLLGKVVTFYPRMNKMGVKINNLKITARIVCLSQIGKGCNAAFLINGLYVVSISDILDIYDSLDTDNS